MRPGRNSLEKNDRETVLYVSVSVCLSTFRILISSVAVLFSPLWLCICLSVCMYVCLSACLYQAWVQVDGLVLKYSI